MKKKIIALLMAAAMTTGLGGYGTYAYLSDQKTVNESVNLTLGKVSTMLEWKDPGLGENVQWHKVGANNESNKTEGNQNLDFTNVKPGDQFEIEFAFDNDGTLTTNNILAVNNSIEGLDISVRKAVKGGNVNKEKVVFYQDGTVKVNKMSPSEYIVLDLVVTVNKDITASNLVISSNINDFVTVTAEQVR